jgi:hypothetical protein
MSSASSYINNSDLNILIHVYYLYSRRTVGPSKIGPYSYISAEHQSLASYIFSGDDSMPSDITSEHIAKIFLPYAYPYIAHYKFKLTIRKS